MNIAIIGRSEILYDAAIKLLKAGHKIQLIITSKAAPEYEKNANDFELLAEEINAKFLYESSVTVDKIKPLVDNIDIGISFNYINVIPMGVIKLFSYGILNAHGGDLPKYRGNACQAWAILNGEEHVGLCIHKMHRELDAGDIIVRDYYPITYSTKIGMVLDWMRTRIPDMFVDALCKIEIDPEYILEAQSTKSADILRCYPRKPEDGRISWQSNALDIIRLINASHKPYAGAFCFFDEKQVVIWDAVLIEDMENFLAIPGQVMHINKEDQSIVVAAGVGKIKINKIESDGMMLFPADLIKSLRDRLH